MNGLKTFSVQQISSFFAQQFSKNIIILTKSQLSTDEATQLFRSLTREQRTCIIFHYCNNFQSVLDKLLTLDSSATVPPKLIIIESLVCGLSLKSLIIYSNFFLASILRSHNSSRETSINLRYNFSHRSRLGQCKLPLIERNLFQLHHF